MAIGDIAGDIQNTYGQGLTPEQRAARQAALAQGSAPSSLTTSPISAPPAGPIGRAQQKLAPTSSLNDPSFGLSSQGDARQTSFDVTNTPSKYLPPASQPAAVVQPIASPAASPPPTQVAVPTAQQAPAPLSSLNQANLVTPIPQGPQPPPLTNLAQVGSTIGTGLLSPPPSALPAAAPIGPVPTATSPTVDPYKIQSVRDQNSLHNASILANPTPIDPASLPGPITQDQFRPMGVGAGSLGGQIVARVGPSGEPQFSNAPADQQSARGLGQISVSPASSPQPNASLASLGSAGNLGDGVGAFSQAQAGDAALSAARFGRANELRQGYANQDRLNLANARNTQADNLTIVRDSSKPFTRADQIQAGIDQQAKQGRQQAVGNAQSLIDANLNNRAGEQQLNQASSLNDLRATASAPGATAADQNRYLAAADPKGFLQAQQKAPLAALEVQGKQLDNQQKAQSISQNTTTQQQAQQDRSLAKEGQLATFDQALGSIDSILGTEVDPANPDGPRKNEAKGLTKTLGPIDGLIWNAPGTEGADFEAKLDTLKAQTFLPQVAALRGTGALSDSEGKKLTDSVGALSTKMSEGEFRKSLAEVRSTLQAAKGRVERTGPSVAGPQAVLPNQNQGGLTAQARNPKPADHSNLWGG